MLEMGKPGNPGTEQGACPVFQGGAVVARLRASDWREAAMAEEGATVELEIASRWKGTYRYMSAGRPLAGSGMTGGWSSRPTPTADAELTLPHQVFVFWLQLDLQRRATAAVAA